MRTILRGCAAPMPGQSTCLIYITTAAALLTLGGLVPLAAAFNLDTTNTVIQERPGRTCDRDCMFGFSVAQHSESGYPWSVSFYHKKRGFSTLRVVPTPIPLLDLDFLNNYVLFL